LTRSLPTVPSAAALRPDICCTRAYNQSAPLIVYVPVQFHPQGFDLFHQDLVLHPQKFDLFWMGAIGFNSGLELRNDLGVRLLRS